MSALQSQMLEAARAGQLTRLIEVLPTLEELMVGSEILAAAEGICDAPDGAGIETWRIELLLRFLRYYFLLEQKK